MAKRVLCFGEPLLRMSPALNGAWLKDHNVALYLGGAELNTASALALWGTEVEYFTALPHNLLTDEIINYLRERNIGTSSILISGSRIGSYYLPQGADLKHAGVIYDRAHSSFSELKTGTIDWDKIMDNIGWFHFSAITAGLSENMVAICKEALAMAAKKGLTISCDLNYRAKLWQYGKKPIEVMPELLSYCNVVMGNIWSIEQMAGVKITKDTGSEKQELLLQAEISSAGIMSQFLSCRQVANTFRFDQNGSVQYFGTLYDHSGLWVAGELCATKIVDKVGSGDAFMAGLIYGNLHGLSAKATIDLATAAGFKKLFVKGDATTATIPEIQNEYLNHV